MNKEYRWRDKQDERLSEMENHFYPLLEALAKLVGTTGRFVDVQFISPGITKVGRLPM